MSTIPDYPEIHNHYHFHHHEAPGKDVVEALEKVEAQLTALTIGTNALALAINSLEDQVMADLANLNTEVSENTTAVQAAVSVITGQTEQIRVLGEQVAALQAQIDEGATDQAAVDAAAATLDSNSNSLDAAVTAAGNVLNPQ